MELVILYHHWSSLIWHEEEGFPFNVGVSKPKMTTSATLGLGKNCLHNYLLLLLLLSNVYELLTLLTCLQVFHKSHYSKIILSFQGIV